MARPKTHNAKIVELYTEKRMSAQEIAKDLNLSTGHVFHILKDEKVERRCYVCRSNPAPNQDRESRCEDCRTTCESCGNQKPSNRSRNCRKCDQKESHLKNVCECGELKSKRAARCKGCSYLVPKSSQLPVGTKRASGDGYIKIKVDAAPRGSKDGNWRLEHHVVEEEKLGRSLRPGEEVHHKNLIRSDNRPDNLELWKSSQPSGARVSDLVKWAREIEVTYGEEFDKGLLN